MLKKEQSLGLPKHKHCAICGVSIPVHKSFCSKDCEEKDRKLAKRRTYTLIFTVLLFPALMFFMLLFSGLRR